MMVRVRVRVRVTVRVEVRVRVRVRVRVGLEYLLGAARPAEHCARCTRDELQARWLACLG